MPVVVGDVEHTLLLATQLPQHNDAPKMTEITAVPRHLFAEPGRPNQRNGCVAPGLPLQLVSCMLQRVSSWRFGNYIFEIGFVEHLYSNFERNGNSFADGEMEGFFQLLEDANELYEQSLGEVKIVCTYIADRLSLLCFGDCNHLRVLEFAN